MTVDTAPAGTKTGWGALIFGLTAALMWFLPNPAPMFSVIPGVTAVVIGIVGITRHAGWPAIVGLILGALPTVLLVTVSARAAWLRSL